MRSRKPTLGAVAAIAGLCLVAACSNSSTKRPSTTSGAASSSSATSAAPKLRGIDPHPLPQLTSVKLSVTAPLEILATPYMAKALNEFKTENLDVTIVNLSTPDAITQIASGNVDACTCAVGVPALNAINSGIPLKVVSSLYLDQPGFGLYVKPALASGAPASLKGKKIAVTGGFSTIGALYLTDYLSSAGLTLSDVTAVKLAPTDYLTALTSGGADAAFLSTPFSAKAISDGTAKLVYAPKPGGPILGMWFGDKLLKNQPEVGQALLRALARTNQKDLAPGYRNNDAIMTTMATALGGGTTVSALRAGGGEIVFASKLQMDTWDQQLNDLQNVWIKLGGILKYNTPLPASQVIDTGPLTKAIG